MCQEGKLSCNTTPGTILVVKAFIPPIYTFGGSFLRSLSLRVCGRDLSETASDGFPITHVGNDGGKGRFPITNVGNAPSRRSSPHVGGGDPSGKRQDGCPMKDVGHDEGERWIPDNTLSV